MKLRINSIYAGMIFQSVGLLLFIQSCGQQDTRSIREIHKSYIHAVMTQDLSGLMGTITACDTLHFIDAGGRIIETREAYLRFHQEWFQTTGWKISFDLEKVYSAPNWGYTMSTYCYTENRPNGQRLLSKSYVTLIFHKENGEWRIVADICSPISRNLE